MKKEIRWKLFGFIPLFSIKEKMSEPKYPYSGNAKSEEKSFPEVKMYKPYQIGKQVEIGRGTYVSSNSHISMTKIGKFCSIGPNLICGWGIHPTNGISTAPCFYSTSKQNGMTFCAENKIEERKPIVIGNDVFIGMNVCILDGVTIGDGAVIGAGAVVNKDIPPYAIAVGVPARVIKYRFPSHIIEKMQKIQWWNWPDDKLQDVEKMFFDIEEFVKKYGDTDENGHTSADI